MMDLLGADLPLESGLPGEFAWADGPLLAALKAGDWVLLDELNLAGVEITYERIWVTSRFLPEMHVHACPPLSISGVLHPSP